MLRIVSTNLFRLWYWLRSIFISEPEVWTLIQTEHTSIRWIDTPSKIEERIYYYLYVSNYGNRKCEIKEQGYCALYEKGKQHNYYLEHIYPWLQGKDQDQRLIPKGKANLRVIK